MQVQKVAVQRNTSDGQTVLEEINMAPVTGKPFDADGNSDDNSFARWTPCGSLNLTISNPALEAFLQPIYLPLDANGATEGLKAEHRPRPKERAR